MSKNECGKEGNNTQGPFWNVRLEQRDGGAAGLRHHGPEAGPWLHPLLRPLDQAPRHRRAPHTLPGQLRSYFCWAHRRIRGESPVFRLCIISSFLPFHSSFNFNNSVPGDRQHEYLPPDPAALLLLPHPLLGVTVQEEGEHHQHQVGAQYLVQISLAHRNYAFIT